MCNYKEIQQRNNKCSKATETENMKSVVQQKTSQLGVEGVGTDMTGKKTLQQQWKEVFEPGGGG